MKNINKKLLAGYFILTMALLGCKDTLEVKSDAKLLVPKSITDLQGIMDDIGQMNQSGSPSYGEVAADDYFIPLTLLNSTSQAGRDIYSWGRYDYRFPNDWSKSYVPIYNANLVLDLLGNVERNSVNSIEWDNVRGTALFYRSFYLFMLTVQYGAGYDQTSSARDLGVVIRLTSDFNVKSVRSSVLQCLERSIADAEVAVGLLPNNASFSNRPTKAAAYALLSKIYLYMGDYSKSLFNADECLKIKSVLMDYNSDSDILGLDLAISFKRFNKETIFYCEMNDGFGILTSSLAKVDTLLYASYDNNDLRKRAYFRLNGGYQQFKGTYTGATGPLFSGIATDEIYLIRAESKARTGDIKGGMADLNTLLRKRWRNTVVYSPSIASNQQDAINKILVERRKELVMRGIRWSDLKRYNKSGASIRLERRVSGGSIFLEPNSSFYALPLPVDIIEQTGMEQN